MPNRDEYFTGDIDDELWRSQGSAFNDNVHYLFHSARGRFFQIRDRRGFDITFLYRLTCLKEIESTMLESAIESIAAYYRYTMRDDYKFWIASYPRRTRSYLTGDWTAYFKAEADVFTQDPAFTRVAIHAVMNTDDFDEWYPAGQKLVEIVNARYGTDYCREKDARYAAARRYNAWRQRMAKLPKAELDEIIFRYMRAFVFAKATITTHTLTEGGHEPSPIFCNDCGPEPLRLTVEQYDATTDERFSGYVHTECTRCLLTERLVMFRPPISSLLQTQHRPCCECGHDSFYPVSCWPPEIPTTPKEGVLAGECAWCRRPRIFVRDYFHRP